MMEYPTDGSGALQPQPTNEYITRDDLIEIVTEIVHRELSPMKQEVANLRLAIQGAPRKEDTVTPAQVKTEIAESEQKIIRLVSDQVNGLADTVRQYSRKGQEQVRVLAELINKSNQDTNDKFLKITEKIVEVSSNAHRGSTETRNYVDKELDVIRGEVQSTETKVTSLAVLTADYDARYQSFAPAVIENKNMLKEHNNLLQDIHDYIEEQQTRQEQRSEWMSAIIGTSKWWGGLLLGVISYATGQELHLF